MLKTGDNLISHLLTDGKIGVIPTDTLYGVVACAANETAVNRLYKLKRREGKPGTLIAASIEQLTELGLKKRYVEAVKDYWPNPISVVMPTGQNLSYLHLSKYSLAVRIPNSKSILELLEQTGPLLTSSANQPGEEPVKNIDEAITCFKDKVDFYVDGGELKGKPSTVIRIVDDAIEILRDGAVKIDEQTGRVLA
jgi:L-threonylcarbamoyladenylate synthase